MKIHTVHETDDKKVIINTLQFCICTSACETVIVELVTSVTVAFKASHCVVTLLHATAIISQALVNVCEQ